MDKVLKRPVLDFSIAADAFYEHLFAALPGIQKQFKSHSSQRVMFIAALQSIRDYQNNDNQLKAYMAMLGAKHINLGLSNSDIIIGREAFEKAIDAGGMALTPYEKQRYLDAFMELTKAMGFEV